MIRRPMMLATLCLAVGMVIGMVIHQSAGRLSAPQSTARNPPLPTVVPSPVPAQTLEQKSNTELRERSFIREMNPMERHGVAIITYLTEMETSLNDDWLRVGQRLQPGVLTLPKGELQLDFLNGARVLVQGPATLKIHSINAATLLSGRAAAYVPTSARGFVLNTPDTAVVDLGTEFMVAVDEQGESSIYVTDGEVEVSLLGEDGNTVTSERVRESGSVRVRRQDLTLEFPAGPDTSIMRIPHLPVPSLPVGEDYVNTIKEARPFMYWRFEELHDGRVPNEMGNEFPLMLHMEESDSSISLENGAAVFRPSEFSRCFSLGEGLTGWNEDSFSIEVWACPQRLKFSTLFDISNNQHQALNVVETAFNTSWIHTPGAIRFLHRHPPSQDHKRGVNAFSPETCTPGQWSHIVAVKTPEFISLSINGQEVRRIETDMPKDGDVYQLIIGQMGFVPVRQYEGALDEIALYHRALTSEEIGHHYQLLMQGTSVR
ncbi:MAG TPA: LamG-like jellyroll fold domain-containing protein [Planctomicrobium sp.]|nr:LamG-like jellyroll fold domain-containing protein [Planctomicrobium sp.]